MAWSLLGASSLLLGALAAFFLPIGKRLLGIILGFGAGVLISAVAYRLVEEAVVTAADRSRSRRASPSARWCSTPGDAPHRSPDVRAHGRVGGLAIVLGAVLDGIPESVVIGASLLTGDQGERRRDRCRVPVQHPRGDRRLDRPRWRRVDEGPGPRALGRRGRDEHAGRGRGLRPAGRRVRLVDRRHPGVRGRRDPDDAGRRDDARGVRVREAQQVGRSRGRVQVRRRRFLSFNQ